MTITESKLASVQERMIRAAQRSGRNPSDVTLVAVTKTQSPEVIQVAYDLGLRDLGENRLEEAETKIGALPGDIRWHMIGHVQSRKAKRVVPLFGMVHSVDSVKLARKLASNWDGQAAALPILLECNVSGEANKDGLLAGLWDRDPVQKEAFFAVISEIVALEGIAVQGLMTMAPIVSDPELARPVFSRLRRLRDELAAVFPGCTWRHLSMGMTDDFQVAIEEGATLIRVGRALFA